MEGMIILAVLFFIGLPIISLVMISSLSTKVSALEDSIRELTKMLKHWEERGRGPAPSGDSTVESQQAATGAPSIDAANGEMEQISPQPTVSFDTFNIPDTLVAPLPNAMSAASSATDAIPPVQGESVEAAAERRESTETFSDAILNISAPEEEESREQEAFAPAAFSTAPQEEEQQKETLWERVKPSIPAAVPEPSRIEAEARKLLSWLLKEGNIWVTMGVLLFLVGFGLLFSYAAQMGWVSLEMRLAGSAVIGIAMTAFGWRMRERRRTYALILQGGGIGVLYIVLLAGAKLGPVIPTVAAIVGMLLLSGFTVILALLQDFELLAIFALLGGFAAPILVSSGSSNFVALFSIYSLLNLEILLITTQRDWRKTRWGGLIASAAVGAVWGILRWQEAFFTSVEPLLILFFFTYSAISLVPLLHNRIAKVRNGGRVDLPMTATIPFVFLFLQIPAASHTKYGVALTCLAMGAWYLLLAQFVLRNRRAREMGCNPSIFLAYCIIFSNLAIPFIFKQAAASAIWAVEGAFLIVAATRRKREEFLTCGLLLHAAAFLLYHFAPYLHLPAHLYDFPRQAGLLDWRNETSPFLLTGILFALSAFVSSYFSLLFERDKDRPLPNVIQQTMNRLQPPEASEILSWGFAGYGAVWWTLAVFHAVFVSFESGPFTAFSILCASGCAAYLLSNHLRWRAIRILATAPVAIVLFRLPWRGWVTLSEFSRFAHPTNFPLFTDTLHVHIPNWPAFAAMFAAAAYAYRKEPKTHGRGIAWGLFLFAFLAYTVSAAGYLAYTLLEKRAGIGEAAKLGRFLPILIATALLALKRFREQIRLDAYRIPNIIALGALLLIFLRLFIIDIGEAGTTQFYIPFLNPIELWQGLYLFSIGLLLQTVPQERVKRIGLHYALPTAAFFWINSVAARAAWQYFGERIAWGHMADAPHFQGLIAILWGFTALALIFGGKKFTNRIPWFMGAALLALDIAKLLLIDLRNSATMIRILAFLLLGGLFLLIGWIAPLPPKPTDPLEDDVAKRGRLRKEEDAGSQETADGNDAKENPENRQDKLMKWKKWMGKKGDRP